MSICWTIASVRIAAWIWCARIVAAGRHAPSILLAGMGDRSVDVEAMEAGAADYLIKSEITPALLERSIRYARERARLLAREARALAEARAERERFQAVGGLTSDFAYAFRLLADGTMVPDWISGAFVRITGYTPEELDASGGWATLIHPDDLIIFQERWGALLAGRALVSEFRIVAKGGEVRWLREHLLEPGEGQVGYAAVQDITDAHQAGEAIRRQAQLLDTVGQAVIATGLDGTITYWNRAAEALYGWSAAEALGRSAALIVPTSLTQPEAAEIMAAIRAGASWSGEYMMQHRDGRVFPVLVSDVPIRDERGDGRSRGDLDRYQRPQTSRGGTA